jgi:hypothetical protein
MSAAAALSIEVALYHGRTPVLDIGPYLAGVLPSAAPHGKDNRCAPPHQGHPCVQNNLVMLLAKSETFKLVRFSGLSLRGPSDMLNEDEKLDGRAPWRRVSSRAGNA